MTKSIRCINLQGEYRDVPVDQLLYRPAVYGCITHQQRLLVYHSAKSKSWMLPGGKIELGETALEALHRETREEVGLEIVEPTFLFADDQFYYHEGQRQGFQVYSLYYLATPVVTNGEITPKPGAETSDLEWLPYRDVHPTDFHPTGQAAIKIFLKRVGYV